MNVVTCQYDFHFGLIHDNWPIVSYTHTNSLTLSLSLSLSLSHTHTHTHRYIYIYIYVCVCVCVWERERERVRVFTKLSTRVGCDKRSIFKLTLIGLNIEFSFSSTHCLTKANKPSLPYYLPIPEERIIRYIPSQGY